jgi:hypothetical protein
VTLAKATAAKPATTVPASTRCAARTNDLLMGNFLAKVFLSTPGVAEQL